MLGRNPSIVLCCPEAFEDVQKTQFDAFDKSPFVSEAMHDALGQGIFVISGPLWHHQRKTASHLFSAQMMQYAMEVVVPEKGEALVKRLNEICEMKHDSERVVNMKRLLDLYTMDIFAKVGFDVDLRGVESDQNGEFLDAFDRMSVRLLKRIQQPIWYWKLLRWLNVGPEKQMAQDIKLTNDMVYGVISRSIEEKIRQESSSSRRDLISLFIDKSEVEYTKGVHTKKDLKLMRDFVISFLVAGRETTATTMTWIILMLNRYPKVLEQIRQELKDKLPDLFTGKMRAASLDDIQQLVYLEAVVRETLRLFPVVSFSGRSATRDVHLYDGTFIKAGTRVAMPHYAMGRMPTVWGSDVDAFKPERWIDPATNKIKMVSPFKFSVFLGGPRMCIGMKFALAEVKITLAKLLSQFDFRTVKDPVDFAYKPSLTLQIKGPLDVVVTKLKQK
ncbi:Cytochrome P450 [Phytophthora megakarya]|uniref:Cytochrome P450 n=1 Tax=Phytophthora megakarya TaxID=4795 RepID=A0A225WHB4_9STRA|nr:Cytochrome P450 [Phytophthora megakarya]